MALAALGSCRIGPIYFLTGWHKRLLNQALVSLCLVLLEKVTSYLYMSCKLAPLKLRQYGAIQMCIIIIVIIRPRRCHSTAAYSHQTFPWMICWSIGSSVGLSSALCKNSGLDPDAVWHHRSRDEAGSGVWGSVHGNGYFWGRIWGRAIVTKWGLYGIHVQQHRDAALFPNYSGQTYYYCYLFCNFLLFDFVY